MSSQGLGICEADVSIVQGSRYFDADWYISCYPDVLFLKISPVIHYLWVGWVIGRDPSSSFSTLKYLEDNNDVLRSGMNPLIHYLKWGERERRPVKKSLVSFSPNKNHFPNYCIDDLFDNFEKEGCMRFIKFLLEYRGQRRHELTNNKVPSKLFDAKYYLNRYPDIARAGVDPYAHYIDKGWKEHRNPNAYFDTKWYLSRYEDVKKANIDPLNHYERNGVKEGRNPSRLFDTRYYLDVHRDVEKAEMNPLEHYIRFGFKEGRLHHPLYRNPENDTGLSDEHCSRYSMNMDVLGIDLIPQYPLKPKEAENLPLASISTPESAGEIIHRVSRDSSNKIALVSANFGVRDDFHEFPQLPDVDCYLFSDRPVCINPPWCYLPIDYYEADTKRQSLYYKTHLCEYFSGYDYVIWCDQNVIPSFKCLADIFVGDIPNLTAYKHWGRNCLYQEAEAVLASRRDSKQVVDAQIKRYRSAGFPENYGLFETNVMVLNPKCKEVRDAFRGWWGEIVFGSKRDQLSFTYVLWLNQLVCHYLEEGKCTSRDSENFEYFYHD